MRSIRFALPLAIGLLAAASAGAVEVTERHNAQSLWFDGGRELTNAVLQITGPDGFTATVDGTIGRLPAFQVQGAGKLKDGLYQYVLTAATDRKVEIDASIDNGRGENARDFAYEPFSMFGAFRISRGSIVAGEAMEGDSDQDQE